MLDIPGMDASEVDALLQDVEVELSIPDHGWEITYQMVWARKP